MIIKDKLISFCIDNFDNEDIYLITKEAPSGIYFSNENEYFIECCKKTLLDLDIENIFLINQKKYTCYKLFKPIDIIIDLDLTEPKLIINFEVIYKGSKKLFKFTK